MILADIRNVREELQVARGGGCAPEVAVRVDQSADGHLGTGVQLNVVFEKDRGLEERHAHDLEVARD